MPLQNTFKFDGILKPLEGHSIAAAIFIPAKVLQKLPQKRIRVKGTMNDVPFSLAVQFRKNGSSFFMVGAALRKLIGLPTGSKVSVKFHVVDANEVDLPEELAAVLDQDLEGRTAWLRLTPGLQRSLCIYITAVKNVDSRIKRSFFILNKVKAGDYEKSTRKKR